MEIDLYTVCIVFLALLGAAVLAVFSKGID